MSRASWGCFRGSPRDLATFASTSTLHGWAGPVAQAPMDCGEPSGHWPSSPLWLPSCTRQPAWPGAT